MYVTVYNECTVRPENTVTYSAGNGGQKICGAFSETASFKSYGVICLPTGILQRYCSGILRNFSRQSFLKLLKG